MTDPQTTAGYTATDKSPAEIEADIRRTRAEMDETFDALGDRLHPDYLKEQAKDALRDTARDAGSSMIDTLRDNPIPSLIAALSVGWLIAKGGKDDRASEYGRTYGDRPGRRADAYRADYYADPTARAAYAGGSYGSDPSLGDRASGAADAARSSVQHAADRVGDAAHSAADRTSDAAHHAAQEARTYGRRAQNWLEQQIDRNPLGVGAAALAAGALVGLAVPGTDWEDEQMGEQRDRFVQQAEGVVDEKLGQAKRVASDVADEAGAKAKGLADSAKKEADKQVHTDAPNSIGASASSRPAGATANASDPRAGNGV